MQVFWVPQDLFFIRDDFCVLFVKSDFKCKMCEVERVPEQFIFCGGVLKDQVVIWAKPGILKEEYIEFFEYIYTWTKMPCNEILTWTFKCIQHALSLTNSKVTPTLDSFAVQLFNQDEF